MTFTFRAMTRLAEHLSSTDTTDATLAAKVNCDRSMITKIRAGKVTPSLRLAAAISRETGIPIEAFIAPRADEPAAVIPAQQDIPTADTDTPPLPLLGEDRVEAAE